MCVCSGRGLIGLILLFYCLVVIHRIYNFRHNDATTPLQTYSFKHANGVWSVCSWWQMENPFLWNEKPHHNNNNNNIVCVCSVSTTIHDIVRLTDRPTNRPFKQQHIDKYRSWASEMTFMGKLKTGRNGLSLHLIHRESYFVFAKPMPKVIRLEMYVCV